MRLNGWLHWGLGIGLMGMALTTMADSRFITIATGGVTGVYYPTGGAICRLVNKDRKQHGIRCSTEATGGSVFNLNVIRKGESDFGVVQSDWQYHAYMGSSTFKAAGPFQELRAVFSIHGEPFSVMARQDANVREFQQLEGKRVNIGNPGSGTRATMDVLLKEMQWGHNRFTLAAELKASEMAQALCDNKIDAFVYPVGHPSSAFTEASSSCQTNLVNVTGPAVTRLIDKNRFYTEMEIPGGLYAGSDETVKTFGVKATLVTSTKIPEEVVYRLTKAVFENFDAFKKLHPAFAHLKREDMLKGNSAPLHQGAEKYFKEVGMLP